MKIARYRCCGCGEVWMGKCGPQPDCARCGSRYCVWLNYEELKRGGFKMNVKLSDYAMSNVASAAKSAADAAFEAGGSPRAQIDAARKRTGSRLTHVPHIGNAQRERARKRMERKAEQDRRRSLAHVPGGVGASEIAQ